MKKIEYRIGNDLDLEATIELYRASTLGERRPISNKPVMSAMIRDADLIVTAWDGELMVGIARTLTDFAYSAYLSDLAVHADYQRQGIGKALIDKTIEALDPTCFLTLLAAPAASEYYAKIGFEHHPRAWVTGPRVDPKRIEA